MKTPQENAPVSFTRFPVVSLSAEYLVMGHLMRRNVLAYKAPPNNEGYDLICIHPDPRSVTRQIRVQVKSRLASDHGGGFPVKARTIDAFDYLIVAFLNVGYFFHRARRCESIEGRREPDFYTFPASFIREHHDARSSWEKVMIRGLDLSAFHNERGFELIAAALGVEYPSKKKKMPKAVQPTPGSVTPRAASFAKPTAPRDAFCWPAECAGPLHGFDVSAKG